MPAKNRFDYFSDCILLKALFDLKLIYQINERFETRSVLELTRKLSVDTGNFLNEHFEVDFRGYTRCLERLYERRRKLKSWGRVPNNSAGTWLRKRLGISDEAYALYLLFATVSENSGFEALLDTEGNLSTTQFVAICSSLLSIAADDLRQELTSDSVLIRTGLVDLMTERASFSNKFIIRSCISSMLLSPDSTRHDLLEHLLIRAAKSNLVLADFEHLNTDLKAIVPFLRKAVETEMAGCNILLYGSPGTGKTELARLLAKHCARSGYEIVYQSFFGAPLRGRERLFRLKAACEMLRYDHSIFIMDEIEDTVPWDKHFRDDSGVSKSWFNNALEANPVCTIWISNCAKQMDPAFLRRFSYCLHVTIPGEKKRASLIRKHLKRNCVSVDPGTVTMLAKQQFLSPAHIQSTDVILSTISTGEMGDGMTEKVFLNKLQAAGLVDHSILRKNADTKRCDYYPQYSNTSISLEEMAINLGKVSEGRYCLYGPAGTGKTGFVKYLADRLKKPVLQRTASDLLGQYVGQTEQAISAMFKEAKRTEAILLLDEADSFLTDRNGHLRSWETTQVNELLVQMEQYDGLFFCCTNRIESFDKAAARRFDFKIAFDYLRPQQIEGLFRDTLPSADKPDLTQLDRIKRLRNLTPADFEIARRKARLSDHRINSGWLSEQLTEESKFRGDDKANPIGFHPC